MTITFSYDSSTKVMHVYKNSDGNGAVVPMIYVRKNALPTEPPKHIEIELKF